MNTKKPPLEEDEKIQLDGLKKAIPQLQKSMKESQMMVGKDKNVIDAYLKEDWPRFYDYWIYQNRLKNGEKPSTVHYENLLSNFTFKASIAEKELLTKQNLEPVLPPEYLYTIYDDSYFSNSIDRIEKKRNNLKVDNTGLFTVYLFFNSYIYLLLLFILIFLFGAGFTTEKGKKYTLSLPETQPLARYNIFLGKSGVSVVLAIGMALGSILLMVVLGTADNRFGDWSFPVLHYDTDNSADITSMEGNFHFMNMGQYLLETTLLFLATLLFLMAITLFFSLFVNSMISSMIVTVILAAGGYYVSSSPFVSPIAYLSPFTYLNLGKIANGELAALFHNSSLHTGTGLFILLISSIILFGAGLIWFQKSAGKCSRSIRK